MTIAEAATELKNKLGPVVQMIGLDQIDDEATTIFVYVNTRKAMRDVPKMFYGYRVQASYVPRVVPLEEDALERRNASRLPEGQKS